MSVIFNSNSHQVVPTSGGLANKVYPGVNVPIRKPWNLGGGIKGIAPQFTHDTDYEYREWEQIRFTLRNAWNTKYVSQLGNKKRIIGPFRAVMNAGDILCRQNYSCGGPCHVFQSRPGMHGLRVSMGHVAFHCDGSGVPASTCNNKKVYDSSAYTTFLKQQAINKNYNKITYGGDNNNASQSAWRHIRSY
jgi:hypothetical protein